MNKENTQILDALNRIDVFAGKATRDNDLSEAKQLEKDYNLVFDFINKLKHKTIKIPITENDLSALGSGEIFAWTFYGVNVELFNPDINPEMDEDNERVCSICGLDYEGEANEAYPINSGYCCDDCNMKVVVPARLKQ